MRKSACRAQKRRFLISNAMALNRAPQALSAKSYNMKSLRYDMIYTLMPSKVAISPCLSCQCAASPKNCPAWNNAKLRVTP